MYTATINVPGKAAIKVTFDLATITRIEDAFNLGAGEIADRITAPFRGGKSRFKFRAGDAVRFLAAASNKTEDEIRELVPINNMPELMGPMLMPYFSAIKDLLGIEDEVAETKEDEAADKGPTTAQA